MLLWVITLAKLVPAQYRFDVPVEGGIARLRMMCWLWRYSAACAIRTAASVSAGMAPLYLRSSSSGKSVWSSGALHRCTATGLNGSKWINVGHVWGTAFTNWNKTRMKDATCRVLTPSWAYKSNDAPMIESRKNILVPIIRSFLTATLNQQLAISSGRSMHSPIISMTSPMLSPFNRMLILILLAMIEKMSPSFRLNNNKRKSQFL